jgi:DNA polymerase-1
MAKLEQLGENTLFLIDGSGFLYRAYFGMRPLHTSQGVPVQAVYSFCRMIKKIVQEFDPKNLVLVWDSKWPTERHQIFQEYKIHRQEPPSDMQVQRALIKEFATLIKVPQLEQPGIEADDLIYSLALDAKAAQMPVLIITSDKDMAQALYENVITLYDPFKNEYITQSSTEQKFGFPIARLPLYYGLIGDSSDNIPGVRGIGPKTAAELAQQFSSMHELYANIAAIKKEKVKQTVLADKENALLSEQLFKPIYHTLPFTLADAAFDKENWKEARPLFEKLEFASLLKELPTPEKVTADEAPVQGKLLAVTDQVSLDALVTRAKKASWIAIDTELTGIHPLEDMLIGISISIEHTTGYYIPFGHLTEHPQLSREIVYKALREILHTSSAKLIMHHAKFDLLALISADAPIEKVDFDTMIAANLVTPDWQSVSLKKLSSYYLHEKMLTFQEVVSAKKLPHFGFTDLKTATDYAAADALQTFKLKPLLEKLLEEQHMTTLFSTIEMPLVTVLYHMEKQGIFVDTAVLKELDTYVSQDLATLYDQITSLCGVEQQQINLNSTKQVGHLLFECLKLPPQKKSTKKTGYSTDVEVLTALAAIHPVPSLLLKYRELSKLKSTYIDALPAAINPKTGKIHTDFSQTSVSTGRLASSNPNLQNIPISSPYPLSIRSAFKAEKGSIFISADYSQIELRVLAYLSQDANLLNAFAHNHDIHTETAARLFNVPLEAVTSAQRGIGKRINFSILYGLSAYGLSKDLTIPLTEAKKYITTYFAQYPGVQAWMDSIVESTKKLGYVTTHWGRRRYIPAIHEKNKVLYELGKRLAINTVAQGTAAEIMKQGMIKLHHAFTSHLPEAHILLQIHDELLITVPENKLTACLPLIQESLEKVVSWNVPLQISLRTGYDWQEVTK